MAPCTATGTKCFNTFDTCKDTENFTKEVKTYSLCTETSMLPVGMEAMPCITSVDMAPTRIETKGLSLRASVTVKCKDFPHHDRVVDPYWRERGGLPEGTFWGRFKARNLHVVNRVMRIKSGYVDGAGNVETETRTYLIDTIDGPDANGNVTIKGKDILAKANDQKTKAPAVSEGKLTADIDEVATLLPLVPEGIIHAYPDTGLVKIGDEVIAYTSKTENGLSGLSRGQRGTVAATHELNDQVQLCLEYVNATVPEIIKDLLVTYAGIDEAYIPFDDWVVEGENWLGLITCTTLIAEPKGVSELLEEILESTQTVLWWDEVSQQIRFKVVQAPLPDNLPKVVTDAANILMGTTKVKELESERMTRVLMYYKLLHPTDELKKENFRTLYAAIDKDAEGVNAFNEAKERTILSRWIQTDPIARDICDRLLARFRGLPKQLTFTLDARDGDLKTGDLVDVYSRLLQAADGSVAGQRLLVVERQETKEGSHVEYVGISAGRVGVTAALIAPNVQEDWTQMPPWTAASPDQTRKYLYICGNDGLMSDGTPGKVIV